MTGKRNIGSVAAIGGLSAAIALLTGLPAASADELADLRANQELLQKRIDQLSQAPPPGAPGPYVPGFGPETRPTDGAGHGRQLPAIVSDPRHRHLAAHRRHRLDRRYLVVARARGGGTRSTAKAAIPTPVTDGMGGTGGLPSIPLNNSIGHSRSTAFDISRGRAGCCSTPGPRPPGARSRPISKWISPHANENAVDNGSTAVTNGWAPRLRKGYGTMGGLLVGQETGMFHDPDADAELIDFGGGASSAGRARVPQVKYTYQGPYGTVLAGGIENPDAEAVTPSR